MLRILTTTSLILLPTLGFANDQLNRLEAVSEEMHYALFDAMIRMAAQEGANPNILRDAVPDGSWDDAFRTAGSCILEKYTAASSTSAVDDMISAMEAIIPKLAELDLESFDSEVDILPPGITEDMSEQINETCGFTDLTIDRMENSGFTAAMLQAMSGN